MASDTVAAKSATPKKPDPTAAADAPAVPKEPPHPLVKLWDSIRPIVVLVLILTALRSSVADWNDVPSGSMKPTILEGDRIFVNKLAFDLKVPFTTWHLATWSQPKRGDICVFYNPKDDTRFLDGTRLVKRCVAVPGDTLEVRNDQLIINGVLVPYGPVDPKYPPNISSREQFTDGVAFETETLGNHQHPVMYRRRVIPQDDRRNYPPNPPITLGPNEFFMMGDNRDNSTDARWFGPVDRRLIVGRASAVAISFDLNSSWWLLHPRWGRFFTGLP